MLPANGRRRESPYVKLKNLSHLIPSPRWGYRILAGLLLVCGAHFIWTQFPLLDPEAGTVLRGSFHWGLLLVLLLLGVGQFFDLGWGLLIGLVCGMAVVYLDTHNGNYCNQRPGEIAADPMLCLMISAVQETVCLCAIHIH